MDKLLLQQQVCRRLADDLALLLAAAEDARQAATHEESKAEDKYDTRGLEASYLAAGQARQTAEVAAALQEFAGMFLKKFPDGEPIDLTALVELEMKKERMFYFIGPASGGLEVEHDGHTVLILTPQSPLGQQLIGKKKGDKLKIKIAGFINEYKIMSVS